MMSRGLASTQRGHLSALVFYVKITTFSSYSVVFPLNSGASASASASPTPLQILLYHFWLFFGISG